MEKADFHEERVALIGRLERARLVGLSETDLVREVRVDLYKASGKGGQKRNKTSSAVRMRHKASGVMSKAAGSRSQSDNRRKAMERLRENLALDLRAQVGEDYRPSKLVSLILSQGPRGKNSKPRRQPDYLLALGDILDVFWYCEASLADAAEMLEVTTSKLAKLLTGDDRVARRALEMRSQLGLRPLRG